MNVHLEEMAGLAAALTAAQTNGLLAALAERPGSPADLAARCRLDARACAHILDLLDAFDLATHDGDCYSAGSDLKELAARSPSIARMEAELWAYAPTFLRSGTPLITMDAAPGEREELYRDVVPELGKMFSTAAEQLADRLSGLAPQSILDVGCGSGVWSLALAGRVPGARVTGLDLPAVLEQFRARAGRLGLGDRVATIAGDMHSAPIPAGQWDLAVIANVLRLEQVAAARSLIERSVAALRPGGSLLIVDALAEGTPAARQSVAVYAFHLAMRTRSGRVHTAAEIGHWMKQAGCEPAAEVPFDDLPASLGALGAMIAQKAVR
jgi:ubiquinone/menaquinone biosynthesis C-methylase UbiE